MSHRIRARITLLVIAMFAVACEPLADNAPFGGGYEPCTYPGECGQATPGCFSFEVPSDGGAHTAKMCTDSCTGGEGCLPPSNGASSRCVGLTSDGQLDPAAMFSACLPLCAPDGACPVGLSCVAIPYGAETLAACLPP